MRRAPALPFFVADHALCTDEVIRVSRTRAAPTRADSDAEEFAASASDSDAAPARKRAAAKRAAADEKEDGDEDVEMVDDADMLDFKPKRKRKAKKVVPVGRNGLKKRRVVKSKMEIDERGYMGASRLVPHASDVS